MVNQYILAFIVWIRILILLSRSWQSLIENEFRDFENELYGDRKLFKMSHFCLIKTSPAVTPYYSYRAFLCRKKSSTSHSIFKFMLRNVIKFNFLQFYKNFKIFKKSSKWSCKVRFYVHQFRYAKSIDFGIHSVNPNPYIII